MWHHSRFFTALFFVVLIVVSKDGMEAKLAKLLRYDVECPFLNEEEFAARLAKGRCPPAMEPPTPTSATTEDQSSKTKKAHMLSKGAKKLLLKFVLLGKKRSVRLNLDEHVDEHRLVEGVFVEMRCPGVCIKNRDKVTWYFNGEKISDSFLNWRVQIDIKGALHLSPVLVNSDEGRFECFVNDDWKGSVQLKVDSTMNALMAGYANFLTGSAFSLLFLVCFLVLSCFWPAVGMREKGSKKRFFWISLSRDDQTARDELDFQEWLLFQVPRDNNKDVRVDIPVATPSIKVSIEGKNLQDTTQKKNQ